VQQCSSIGTYTRIISLGEFGSSQDLCDYTFIRISSDEERYVKINDNTGESFAGIYYRQAIPVKIEVFPKSNPSEKKDFIVFIPQPGSIYKLPVPRNFFADNTTDIELTDGIPTGYDPQKNSEILGLFKIPADVIGAYFQAFGKFFDSFSGAKKSEAQASANTAYLEFQQSKTQLCLKAIAANDSDGIKNSCPTSAP
jgi:hypothetical protein